MHVERKWSLGTQLGRDKNKKRQNSNATSETEIKQQQ